MKGTQLSAGWLIVQTAEFLCASTDLAERQAGRSLRCCEIVGLRRVDEEERKPGTQGVEVSLCFYREGDLYAVANCRDVVQRRVAEAMGLWKNAVQLKLQTIPQSRSPQWIGLQLRSQMGGTGKRLDRYYTDKVYGELRKKRRGKNWKVLGERRGEVLVLLRRLRYQLGRNYGSTAETPHYAYWTTATTMRWAADGEHPLNYLVHELSGVSERLAGGKELTAGNADPAPSLAPGYWGEVDTENDPLRVKEITTRSGVTTEDVQAVLRRAGGQIELMRALKVGTSDPVDALRPFIEALRKALDDESALSSVDVLLVHRGGGVVPKSYWSASNVSNKQRRTFLDLCIKVRNLGVEVVVAIAHANISVLDWDGRVEERLPLGIFEATTPTGAASWILQEHINPGLVETAQIYGQRRAT